MALANKATTKAVEAGHLGMDTDVFTHGENRAVWFDEYFLHSVELAGDEYLYSTTPLVNDWQFEE